MKKHSENERMSPMRELVGHCLKSSSGDPVFYTFSLSFLDNVAGTRQEKNLAIRFVVILLDLPTYPV